MTDKEILTRIGSNLRTLREHRGLTAMDIAAMLDISPDAVRKYERGERDPGIATLIRAKAAISCNFMSFLSGIDDDSAAGTEYNVLSARCSRIMHWLATDWSGDIEALVIFMGLVASFPEQARRDIYMSAALLKDELLRSGTMSPSDLPAGIEYMEQKLGELYEK